MADHPVVLETRDLSKYFGGLHAVEGVNLQIHEGHLHSIIGPNGAGKTTLFNVLSGVLKPTHGRVFLRGQDITDYPPHKIASLGIGRSYQITNIFPSLTVFENVRLAAQALGSDNFRLLTPASAFEKYAAKAAAVLEETGLTDVADVIALSLSHGDKRKLRSRCWRRIIFCCSTAYRRLASEQVQSYGAGGAGQGRVRRSCSWSTIWAL
jgi:branched-chain amino acid transport system ATP-binding protein